MKITFLAILTFIAFINCYCQTVEEYFNSGSAKSDLQDYYGAISDYSKAIEIEPKAYGAYFNRGIAKLK